MLVRCRFVDQIVEGVAETPALLLAANGADIEGEPVAVTLELNQELLDTIIGQLRRILDDVA